MRTDTEAASTGRLSGNAAETQPGCFRIARNPAASVNKRKIGNLKNKIALYIVYYKNVSAINSSELSRNNYFHLLIPFFFDRFYITQVGYTSMLQ